MTDPWDSSILFTDAYHTSLRYLYFAHDALRLYGMIIGSVGIADYTLVVSLNSAASTVCK